MSAALLQGPLVVYAAKASKQAAKTAKGAAKNVKKATSGARKQAKTTSTDQWYGPDRGQFLGKPLLRMMLMQLSPEAPSPGSQTWGCLQAPSPTLLHT